MNKSEKGRDLTEGPIARQLLVFALPLLASSFIQQLYNTVDLLFVGNYLGTDATAAVGASSLFTNCIVSFFTGLSVGTCVLISMAVGEKNGDKIQRVIHTSEGFSLCGGVILAAAGILLSRQILLLMNTPEEILKEGLVYVRIYLVSFIPLFVYNMNAGIIRATGNSRSPMLYQLAGGLLNILLDWVSICVLGLGVAGVAAVSVITQMTAALCTVVYLMRRKNEYHLSLRKIRLKPDILGEIMKIGLPSGVQNMVISLSNIFVQTVINGLGVTVIAAFTAFYKVELIAYYPIVAFGQAVTTFVGQNLGAGKLDRMHRGVNVCLIMGFVYTIIAVILTMYFGPQVFGLFTPDAEVIAVGVRILYITFPFYWLYVILEVYADSLRGAGVSVPPMLIIMLSMCVFRTVILFAFNYIWNSVEAVAVVYPLAWFAAALALTIYWHRFSRLHLRKS